MSVNTTLNPTPYQILTTPTTPVDENGVTDNQSQTQIYAFYVMLVIFSVFGTLGNGLVLYVFTRKNDNVTSTLFILALAWTDFFTCLVFIPFTFANTLIGGHWEYDFICKFFNFQNTAIVPLSAFMMVAIAVDRYFSICHPFLHFMTPKRARGTILCLVILSFLLGTTIACMFGVYIEDVQNVTISVGDASWCSFSALAINTTPSTGQYSLESNFNLYTSALSNISPSAIVEVLIPNNSTLRTSTTEEAGETYGNIISVGTFNCTREENILKYNNGVCGPNTVIFSDAFALLFQKIYMSFFGISLFTVFSLYFFIYRSVVKRRAWRRKQKSWSHSPMSMTQTAAKHSLDVNPKQETLELSSSKSGSENKNTNTSDKNGKNANLCDNSASKTEDTDDETLSNDKDGNHINSKASITTQHTAKTPMINASKTSSLENGVETPILPSSIEKKRSREHRDFNFLANIRTAVMLFVVAVVFIFSFLPAWLMALGIVQFQIIVFYMHFLYNVANPVIYAFMNQSFRKELKRVFQRGTHFLRNS